MVHTLHRFLFIHFRSFCKTAIHNKSFIMPGTENLPKVEANLKEEIEKPSELKHVEVTKFIDIRRNISVYNTYMIHLVIV